MTLLGMGGESWSGWLDGTIGSSHGMGGESRSGEVWRIKEYVKKQKGAGENEDRGGCRLGLEKTEPEKQNVVDTQFC